MSQFLQPPLHRPHRPRRRRATVVVIAYSWSGNRRLALTFCIIPAADWCAQARRLALIIRRRRKYLGREEENIYLWNPKNRPVFVPETELWPLLYHLTATRNFWNVAKTQLWKWCVMKNVFSSRIMSRGTTVDVLHFKRHVPLSLLWQRFISSVRFLCLRVVQYFQLNICHFFRLCRSWYPFFHCSFGRYSFFTPPHVGVKTFFAIHGMCNLWSLFLYLQFKFVKL